MKHSYILGMAMGLLATTGTVKAQDVAEDQSLGLGYNIAQRWCGDRYSREADGTSVCHAQPVDFLRREEGAHLEHRARISLVDLPTLWRQLLWCARSGRRVQRQEC